MNAESLSFEKLTSELLAQDAAPEKLSLYIQPAEFREVPSSTRNRQLLNHVWSDYLKKYRYSQLATDFSNDFLMDYYRHPIWVYHGIYQEFDAPSLKNRRELARIITNLQGRNIVDVGGGFGTLSRMIAESNPNAQVSLIDVEVNSISKKLMSPHSNLSAITELEGQYDVIVSQDVLEHLPDPIAEVRKYSANLIKGGYLVAHWDFSPTIACHLKKNFWMEGVFQHLVELLDFEIVAYHYAVNAFVFKKQGQPIDEARLIRRTRRLKIAKKIFERLPLYVKSVLGMLR